MKKIILISLLLTFLFSSVALGEGGKKKALYFFSNTCDRCLDVEEFLQVSGAYEKYEIQKINTNQSEDNLNKLSALFEAFGVEQRKQGIPAIFFGRKFLAGNVPIVKNFSQMIDDTSADFFPTAEIIRDLSEKEKIEARKQKKYLAEISVKTIFLSAVSDFLNPTSLAIFLILIWLLFLAKVQKKIILSGLIFLLAIFISRLSLAVIFYNFSEEIYWWKYLIQFFSVVSLFFGIILLKDFLWYRQSRIFTGKKVYFFMIRWRQFIEKIVKNILSWKNFFLLGILVSFLLWVQPNDSYRALMETLKIEGNLRKTLGVISLVNLLFIIPFILPILLVWEFDRTKKMTIFGEKVFQLIKILLGAIMLFVGIYLILGLIN